MCNVYVDFLSDLNHNLLGIPCRNLYFFSEAVVFISKADINLTYVIFFDTFSSIDFNIMACIVYHIGTSSMQNWSPNFLDVKNNDNTSFVLLHTITLKLIKVKISRKY